MNQDIEILRLLAKKDKEIEKLYNKLIYQLSKVSLNITKIREGAFFSFDDYPELKAKVDDVLNTYSEEQQVAIVNGINSAIKTSFKVNEAQIGKFSRYSNQAIIDMRKTAAEAFIESRMKPEEGLSLSQKVWNYTRQAKAEFEASMSEILEDGISVGMSAEELGRKLRDKLKHPDMVYRRYHLKKMTAKGKKDVVEWRRKVVDSEGRVRYVKEDLEKVGRGVYRSSRKNALRLTATEINMAYRYADYVRWNSEPFVIGFRIQLSGNHTLNGKPFYDMCDDLVGVYPKTFKWSGWHPKCYSDDSEVLTNRGWKLFKDVQQSDLILSLNPDTRNVEWATIKQQMNWHHKGEMIHYSNRSLDCLVTPEHEMVYLAKSTGKIARKDASEFRMSNGAFYRSCEYEAEDRPSIVVGNTHIPFDLFCEFMGYWLSDGSTIRTVQIVIAQQDGDPNKQKIVECIEKMGFRVHTNNAKVEFYSKDLCQYLKQFGKCNSKYVPQEIKNASKRQIQIFLDAFISCDGHIKKPHAFVGNHGNACISKNPEKIYFTTSKRLEADLGELILKTGKRPSFRINNKAGKLCHFKNGDYETNYDCYSVTECQATTATVFDKSIEEYDGIVYDLELSKNHIMYIRRNGKCFWGSNCRCIATSILVNEEEMEKISELSDEEYQNYRSPNLVKKMPKAYDEYVAKEKDRILASMDRGTTPYWVRDNYKGGDIRKKFVWERIGKTKFKTQTQKDAIQEAWDERRRRNAILAAAEKRHANRDAVAIQEAWDLRKEKYAKLMKAAQNVNMAAYGEPWVDRTNLKWLINKKKYHLLEAEYRKVAKELSLANKRKKQLSALIPDVDDWSQQFSYEELQAVFDNVGRTLKRWEWNFSNQSSIQTLKDAMEHEIEWMSTKGRKYATWRVARDAYKKKLDLVNHRAEMLSVKENIKDELALLESSKSVLGKTLVREFDELFEADSTDITSLSAKALDIKKKAKQIEADRRAAKKASTKSNAIEALFTPKSEDETINDFYSYLRNIGVNNVSKNEIFYDKGFIHLTRKQHVALYEKLKPETDDEHYQLWNHVLKTQRTWRAGYVHTSNSFLINGDFRATKIVGNIDSKAISALKKHGATDDDIVTIKLLDKKISEFSLPVPLRVTRYVETSALDSIFGDKITAHSTSDIVKEINSKKRIIRKDPAYLSASLNENENVFTRYPVKLEIEVPPNTPFYMTDNYDESEVVFSRSTKLNLLSASVEKSGKYIVLRCRME